MSNLVNLPLGESVKRTYLYMFANAKKAVAICSFWYVLVVCVNLLAAFVFPQISKTIYFLSEITVSAAVSVSLVRLIILNEEYKPFQMTFGKREIKYMLYEQLTMFMVLFAVFIVLALFAPSFDTKTEIFGSPVMTLAFIISVFCVTAFVSRSFLLLPAITVENKEMKFSDAFKMSKGNTFKFFAGMFLACAPAFIFLEFLNGITELVTSNAGLTLIMILAVQAATLLYVLIRACYLAHAYQYFIYFYSRQK